MLKPPHSSVSFLVLEVALPPARALGWPIEQEIEERVAEDIAAHGEVVCMYSWTPLLRPHWDFEVVSVNVAGL